MVGRRQRLRRLLVVAAAATGVAFGGMAHATDAFRSLELTTVDTRFSVRGERTWTDEIVLVGVDAKTFEDLGDERWPFTHDQHARVIDRLSRDGAKVIALDIQISEPSNTDEETLALLDAIERAGNVVAATTEVDDRGNGNAFNYYVPEEILQRRGRQEINKFLGSDLRVVVSNGNLPNDPGGVLRRMEYRIDGLKTFAVDVAERARDVTVDPDRFHDNGAWIDFAGPPGTVPHVSYSDVVLGRVRPGRFRDKIVVVGATAPVLQDVHPTSVSGDVEMSGPEIQANAIRSALEGFRLQEVSPGLNFVLVAAMSLLAPVASMRLSVLRGLLLAVVAGLAYAAVAQVAFNNGLILTLVYPLVGLGVASVGVLTGHYLTEAFERERTRDTFARFVPEAVVRQVLAQADGVRLGGVEREVTVMFSDLRGFTHFAERLEPSRVIEILNHYLTAMVDDAILCHGGTLIDYMGDGIMAVFGAPIEMDDHADRALASARDKLAELERFNVWLREQHGFDASFRMGIGLHSGRVIAGNVGSERRLAYTAIGDTTNTAARLEGLTKGTPYMLFISDSTRARLIEQPPDLVFVDEYEVRGREQRVRVWSVTDGQARSSAETRGSA